MSAGTKLVAELLQAVAGGHSPRALVRAIAAVLGAHARLVRVELQTPLPPAIVERVGTEWRAVVAASSARGAVVIAPGLAVVPEGALPDLLTEREMQRAIRGVIDLAARHLDVVHRLAQLSRRAQAENRELRADLERADDGGTVVANSPRMRAALARIAQVARHPTTVLLLGPSGSGKEVLSRELHRRSLRAHRAMLQLNCAAIPETLIESELFGHERGAFTGAERTHAGVFERAHRSTLLLDEVGELSAAAQAKLLRVLQEGRVRRVGGSAEIAVDVRLVAATHRSLAEMVAAGTFREDLYYRLDVFSVEVPALRDRREDLAPLVAAIGGELCARMGVPLPPISRGLVAKLAAHDWPGNVRELRNLLESALVLGGGAAFALPEEFPRRSTARGPRAFDAAVRDTIEDVLRATHGKIYGANGAAARLGMPPATLQSKMKKLGIERRRFA